VHGGSAASISPRLKLVTDLASAEAERLKDEYVSTEHLFIAIAGEEGRSPAARLLKQAGLTRDKIFESLTAIRGSQRVTDQNPEGKYQALERYGRDLTALAQKGKLDPVIGRDDEIRRVIQVLSRRRRTTPSSSASPASARRPSSKASHSASSAATCLKASRTRRSSDSTWAPWWQARSTAASSRSG
jgi:ATP-dependent Clp protease ATP-binding subunit ClpB